MFIIANVKLLFSKNYFKSSQIVPFFNNNYMQIISERMLDLGYTRSADQVKRKLKALKHKFHKVKDSNKTSGQKRTDFALYDLCYNVWGHRASAEPVRLLSSTSGGSSASTSSASEAENQTAPSFPSSESDTSVFSRNDDEQSDKSDTDSASQHSAPQHSGFDEMPDDVENSQASTSVHDDIPPKRKSTAATGSGQKCRLLFFFIILPLGLKYIHCIHVQNVLHYIITV